MGVPAPRHARRRRHRRRRRPRHRRSATSAVNASPSPAWVDVWMNLREEVRRQSRDRGTDHRPVRRASSVAGSASLVSPSVKYADSATRCGRRDEMRSRTCRGPARRRKTSALLDARSRGRRKLDRRFRHGSCRCASSCAVRVGALEAPVQREIERQLRRRRSCHRLAEVRIEERAADVERGGARPSSRGVPPISSTRLTSTRLLMPSARRVGGGTVSVETRALPRCGQDVEHDRLHRVDARGEIGFAIEEDVAAPRRLEVLRVS